MSGVVRFVLAAALLMVLATPLGVSSSSSTTTQPATGATFQLTVDEHLRVGVPFNVTLTVVATAAMENVSASMATPSSMQVVLANEGPVRLARGEAHAFQWQLQAAEPHVARLWAWLQAGRSQDSTGTVLFVGTQAGIPDLYDYMSQLQPQANMTVSHADNQLRVAATYNIDVSSELAPFLEMQLKLRHRVDGKTVAEPIQYGPSSQPLSNEIVVARNGEATVDFEVEYQATARGREPHAGPQKYLMFFRDICNEPFTIDMDSLDVVAPCSNGAVPTKASNQASSRSQTSSGEGTPALAAPLAMVLVAALAFATRKAHP